MSTVFKDVHANVHDEERSGRPSVINEDLVQNVDERVKQTLYDFVII